MRRTLRAVIGLLLLTVIFHGAAMGTAADPLAAQTIEIGRGWNDRYVVSLDTVSIRTLEAALTRVDGELVRVDERLGFAIVETEDANGLARLIGGGIEPDVMGAGALQPNDPYYGSQWALPVLDMSSAWDLQTGDRAVRVAVIDSGVDMGHVDLRDTAFIKGFDYVGRDLDPSDVHGHGTHVAGTIAAGIDNGIGIAGMAEVTIIAIRVLDGRNAGSCSDFASGIAEAVALGADVINLSLYCSSAPINLVAAIRLAEEADVVVVAAAGNFWQGRPWSCVTYPARAASVIAVAAVQSDLSAAGYSCRGPQVEIAAPGSGILSTLPYHTYGSWSGTSMATPHVAATAALLLSHAELSADEVRTALQATARDLGDAGHDETFGHGLVQPVAALQAVG